MILHHPDYSHLPYKINARRENVKHFRSVTGKTSLTRQYWTLCNKQPDEGGSEINQLANLGFINKSQFYGVDWDRAIIEENQRHHPEAHWFAGNWNDVILREDFNPECVYLDTTNFSNRWHAVGIVAHTLQLCHQPCMIFANLMMSDPHTGVVFDPQEFISNLSQALTPSIGRGLDCDIKGYTYNATGKTEMITYVLNRT